MPFAELLDAVLSGAVRDAPVALAVLAAQARGLRAGSRVADGRHDEVTGVAGGEKA